MRFDHVDLEDFIFFVFFIPWLIYFFLSPFPWGSLTPERRACSRHLFRAKSSKVPHSLPNVWLCVSVYFSSADLLRYRLCKPRIYEYNRMTLGAIYPYAFLLFCSCFAFGFVFTSHIASFLLKSGTI